MTVLDLSLSVLYGSPSIAEYVPESPKHCQCGLGLPHHSQSGLGMAGPLPKTAFLVILAETGDSWIDCLCLFRIHMPPMQRPLKMLLSSRIAGS